MNRKPMNRRRFLRLAGIALGAGALSCAGLGALAARLINENQPDNPQRQEPVVLPDLTLGDNTMTKKILVAYASECGSTGGVAEAIGRTLAEGGAAVDVRPVKSVTSLDGYQAAVLGSAIHGGKWLPEAAAFVQANQSRLSQVPTAFFLVCMLAATTSETNRNYVAQYLEPERALVKPVAEGRFAGALFPQKSSFWKGIGLRIFLAYLKLPGGDYRDWDAIRTWSLNTIPLLLP